MAFGIGLLIYLHIETVPSDNIVIGSFSLVFIIAVLHFTLTFTHPRLEVIKIKCTDYKLTKSELHKVFFKYQLNYFSITCVVVGIINLIFFITNWDNYEYSILWTTILIAVPIWGYFETRKGIFKNYSAGEIFNLTQNNEIVIIDSGKRKHILDSKNDRIRLRTNYLILVQQMSPKDFHVLRIKDI